MISRTRLWPAVSLILLGTSCTSHPSTPEMDPELPPAFVPPAVALVTTTETKIVAPNGNPSDLFGFSIALDNDTLVVGTPYEDSAAQDAGAAYVFVRTNGVWTFETKLVAPDFGAARWFGYAVAVDGDNVLVGSPQADGKTLGAGGAYVFRRNNGVWTSLPKIVASDGKPGDMFGQTVDIAGNSLVIGGPKSDTKGADAGAAYIFVGNGNSYVEQKRLVPTDPQAGDHFGAAVAMHGETAIVGAPDADIFGPESGTAYIFFREGNLWSQQKKLISPNGAAGDGFGWAVDIELNTAVVGAPMADSSGIDAGAAYVFDRMGVAWNPAGGLSPKNIAADDRFGSSVAMSGPSIVVGALLDDTAGMNAGAASIFRHNGFSWYESLEVVATDAAAGDAFGFAVAISGQTTAVSAYLDDDLGTSSGATYLYELKNEEGERCVTGGECLSGFCADGVCCDTACDQGPCDACSVAEGSMFAGVCKLLDGNACDDGNACTQTDTCLAGQCMGSHPKTCGNNETCVGTAVCDPATGMCTGDLTPNGTSCDDDNACTSKDSCSDGVCQGTVAIECPTLDACHAAGSCDPATGTCDQPVLPDGTICPTGVCRAGECVSDGNLLFTGGCVCQGIPIRTTFSSFSGSSLVVGLWLAARIRRKIRATAAVR